MSHEERLTRLEEERQAALEMAKEEDEGPQEGQTPRKDVGL